MAPDASVLVGGDIVVPDIETWLIWRMNLNAVLSATYTGSGGIGIDVQQITSREQFLDTGRWTVAAALGQQSEITGYYHPDTPLVLRGGTRLRVTTKGLTVGAGDVTPTGDLLISRCIS